MVDKRLLFQFDLTKDQIDELRRQAQAFLHEFNQLTPDGQSRLVTALKLKADKPHGPKSLQELLEDQYRGVSAAAEPYLEAIIEGRGLKEEQLLAVYQNLALNDQFREYMGKGPDVEAFLNKVQNPELAKERELPKPKPT